MTVQSKPSARPLTGKAPPGSRHRAAATPAREGDERQQREERILDAAATLLVRWGFRKTTIDDVAREAGVGKGTIYLHWRDKNELFRAAIWREYDLLSEDIMRRVNADPQGGLPHRLWAHGMIATLDSPLTAAIMKGQPDIFQGLLDGLDQESRNRLSGNAEVYVAQMQRIGLVRADLTPSSIAYVMSALKIGLIHAPDFTGPDRAPSMEAQTEAISDLLRRWLEPETLPTETEEGKLLLANLLENVQGIAESSVSSDSHVSRASHEHKGE
jgi:AcrR family transcriptional regulator